MLEIVQNENYVFRTPSPLLVSVELSDTAGISLQDHQKENPTVCQGDSKK